MAWTLSPGRCGGIVAYYVVAGHLFLAEVAAVGGGQSRPAGGVECSGRARQVSRTLGRPPVRLEPGELDTRRDRRRSSRQLEWDCPLKGNWSLPDHGNIAREPLASGRRGKHRKEYE